MKKFMLLCYGFEPPTPEIMAAWEKWFESIEGKMADRGGFGPGREISQAGTRDLPMDMDAITGYVIVNAESFGEAERIAADNPFIASIRIYELMMQ